MRQATITLACAVLACAPGICGNWPAFRGPGASGVADGADPPGTFDAEKGVNLLWKTAIPGLAHSSPVTWGDQVFVTTAVSSADDPVFRPGLYGDVDLADEPVPHHWKVYALDRKSGKILWERTAHSGVPRAHRHIKASQANSTPVTDGKHLVVNFGAEGLYCYDLDGTLLWKKDLGLLTAGWFYDPSYQWGYGSSPILYKGLVIVQADLDLDKESFIAAYRLKDGEQVWRTARKDVPSWASPTVYEGEVRAELVTNGGKFLRGYDPATGKELWRLANASEVPVATPVVAHDLFFISNGYRPGRPIFVIRPGASGDISLGDGEETSESVAWSKMGEGTYIPTPIVYGDHFYTLKNNGVLTCYEANTGARLYRERVGGAYTASIVAADGRLYLSSEEGDVHVVKTGREYLHLGSNPVGEVIMATPAIADGMLIVRARDHMFAFGRRPPAN